MISQKRPISTIQTNLQSKEKRISQGFELLDEIELEQRFPNMKNILVVKFHQEVASPLQYSKKDTRYLLSQDLPFVFEVPHSVVLKQFSDKVLANTVGYLSELRRIRIIQSLKNKDLIFDNLNKKRGELVEKGYLEIAFCHPLLNECITSASFPAQFRKEESEIFSLIHLQDEQEMTLPHSVSAQRITFPENCCILTLKLVRKGMTRSFTCLVWFMEKKFKSKKIYFCAVKIDMHTKVNLYFVPKKLGPDSVSTPSSTSSGSQDMDLQLAKVEINIGSGNTVKTHRDKYEFYANIKKSRADEREDNYRFNVESPLGNTPQPQPQSTQGFFVGPAMGRPQLPDKVQQWMQKDSSISACGSREEMTQLIELLHSVEGSEGVPSPTEHRGSSPIPKVILESAEELLAHSLNREKCLNLQTAVKKLEPQTDKKIIDLLLQGIVLNIREIACNTYGNFLLQMLIPKFDATQRVSFLNKIGDSIGELCKDPRGIFCLQALAEQLKSEEEMTLFFGLFTRDLAFLAMDAQAGFVFKKMVNLFPVKYAMELLRLLRPTFYEVAGDKYGICVLKFVIAKVQGDRENFRLVVKDFLAHVKKGRHNSHFNFGLQHLLEVANENRWVLPELETLLSRFFEGKGKGKIRSKSIGQTIQLALCYHRREFVDAQIWPHIDRFLQQPRSENENILLNFVQTNWAH